MTPAQVAKMREALKACNEHETEDKIAWIQGYLAIEEVFDSVKGPVPVEWITDTMTRMEQNLCPLCPDWDEINSLEDDFFGSPCEINGIACCDTCYRVHYLTSPDEDENPDPKATWKMLYGLIREKGYEVYCGYHGEVRDFAITGHADGWNHTFSASLDGLTRAIGWLQLQGQGLSEDERIESRRLHWEEQQLAESSEPYVPDEPDYEDYEGDDQGIFWESREDARMEEFS